MKNSTFLRNNDKISNLIHVKNMVCNRCILVLENVLEKNNFLIESISLGKIEFKNNLNFSDKEFIKSLILPLGFNLIEDKKEILVQKIKNLIIKIVHENNSISKVNISDELSININHDYTYLSNIFSDIEGSTIEKYYISQRVEKIKELIQYNELTLSEIAFQLNYSSVSYLSNQFKKITGFTPSKYKESFVYLRKTIDEV